MSRKAGGTHTSHKKTINENSCTIQELNSYLSHVIDKGKGEAMETDFDGISHEFRINETNFSIFLRNEELGYQQQQQRSEKGKKPSVTKDVRQGKDNEQPDPKFDVEEEGKKKMINKEIFKKKKDPLEPEGRKPETGYKQQEDINKKKKARSDPKESQQKASEALSKERAKEIMREAGSPSFEKKYFSPKDIMNIIPTHQPAQLLPNNTSNKVLPKSQPPINNAPEQSSLAMQRQKQIAILEKIKNNIESNQARLSSGMDAQSSSKILIYKSPQKNENLLQIHNSGKNNWNFCRNIEAK
jgi:hypothetical protein